MNPTTMTTTIWQKLGVDQHSAGLLFAKWGGIAVLACVQIASDPAQMTAVPHALARVVQVVAFIATVSAAQHSRSPLA